MFELTRVESTWTTYLFPKTPEALLVSAEGDLAPLPLATHAYATDPSADAVITAITVRCVVGPNEDMLMKRRLLGWTECLCDAQLGPKTRTNCRFVSRLK